MRRVHPDDFVFVEGSENGTGGVLRYWIALLGLPVGSFLYAWRILKGSLC
jgi:hypothetical protein